MSFLEFGAKTASYANATVVADTIQYQALTAGIVTLSPFADSSGTDYWYLASHGTPTVQSQYAQKHLDPTQGGVINPMQELVVVIGGGYHPVVSLISGTTAGANYGGNAGSLTMAGGNGVYQVQQVTGLGDTTASLSLSNWNPATDTETFAVDVLVGGNQANATQLATLLDAIDGDDGTPSSNVTASTSLSPDPFPGNYNLFLTFTDGQLPGSSSDDLGIDLSNSNDSNLTGYTFSAIAVVPEPISVGLLALGGVGLLARRNRRNSLPADVT